MDEIAQEQPDVQVEPAVQTTQTDPALEERLRKLEAEKNEQRAYLTKLEQENATYRQIITDRGQPAEPKKPTVSAIDAEIAELEQKVRSGEIDQEELMAKQLALIRKAKDASKSEAVSEVQSLYQREQEIQREYSTIFQDQELKAFESEVQDFASGYFQYGLTTGMTPKQAAAYAKDQTKVKVEAFKKRFGITKPVETPKPAEQPSGFKGETESVRQPQQKEKPITAEDSQKSFIQLRREKLARIQGG